MRNPDLAQDYIRRCELRLFALETLYQHHAWADVVREAQEVVELALKALLRHSGIEFPRTHDVSGVLEAEQGLLPKPVQGAVLKLCKISKSLRRDRELAFYGTEDLTPSAFYAEDDAKQAMVDARFVVKTVRTVMEPTTSEKARPQKPQR